MQSTLKTIQTISKIGKILSKIVFIFCIVGGCFCLVGLLSLALSSESFKIGGVTIHGLIEKSDKIGSIGTVYGAMAAGTVLCAGEAVLAKMAQRYFKNELAAGTPFTLAGAKEMLRLGICTICIPLGTMVVAHIIYGIIKHFFSDMADFSPGNIVSVGLGVMFIIMSLICRYGAEVMCEAAQKGEQYENIGV
ncbi:MAG: hypothetical protein IKE65_06250 [Clostridia bacterium]|nr:hypothetical protein [Clostridia bacterium]